MKKREAAARLLAAMEDMPVIDTHEHLCWDEEEACGPGGDVLREYLSHYMRSDVISAGLGLDGIEKVTDPALPIAERWRMVEPYWEAARFTGYGRALDIAAKGIYGIDGVRAGTIEQLNEAFLARRRCGHYAQVLQQLCHIEWSLLDVFTRERAGERPHRKAVWRPENLFSPGGDGPFNLVAHLEGTHGLTLKTLDDWLAAMEAELDRVLKLQQVRILKIGTAYNRTLYFAEVEKAEAEALFRKAMAACPEEGEQAGMPCFAPPLQDYLMHALMRLANERGLTVQFHTGLLEGNGNVLANSNPALLNNLMLSYPGVRFDLFHIGYPYYGEVAALAKMFPNVTVDMCWAHIISPAASRAALADLLDAVPHNKISAFGGDYLFADGVYGHLRLAKENVAAVLAEKLCDGVFDEDRAVSIARAMFYENPKRIFGL